MGPIDPLKNFFQKNPLTPPLSSHTLSHIMEKDNIMNRWARVRNCEDSCVFWINESHVTVLKQYNEEAGGCMIGFSTHEHAVVRVMENADDIFSAWDDWQSIHKDG